MGSVLNPFARSVIQSTLITIVQRAIMMERVVVYVLMDIILSHGLQSQFVSVVSAWKIVLDAMQQEQYAQSVSMDMLFPVISVYYALLWKVALHVMKLYPNVKRVTSYTTWLVMESASGVITRVLRVLVLRLVIVKHV